MGTISETAYFDYHNEFQVNILDSMEMLMYIPNRSKRSEIKTPEIGAITMRN